MNLGPIVARLKSTLPALRSVGVAADLDAAFNGVVATPSAFVLPLAESGDDIDLLSSTGQRLHLNFGVVHGLSNRRDAAGGAAMDDLATHRAALKAALIGWVPNADTGEAVTFKSGRLLKMDGDGRLWWIDEFQLIDYYWSA